MENFKEILIGLNDKGESNAEVDKLIEELEQVRGGKIVSVEVREQVQTMNKVLALLIEH